MRKGVFTLLAFAFACFFFNACSSYKSNPSEVIVWQLSDPDMLNPINSTDAQAQDIDNNIFQPLLNFDYRTLKLVPVLADSLPKLEIDSARHMLITFELRKEAKWDNGTPITAKDVDFTLKVIKNPAINDEPLRTYYDIVNSIIYLKTYSENPRKFTIVCDSKYVMGIISTGTNTFILPEYAYDPNKYLENFTLRQLREDKDIAKDPKIIAFAKDFNSEKFQRDPQAISGSGAYKFVSWTTGQRVVLEKKKEWWGNSLSGTNCFFDANASKLIYQTINDMTSALVSLKAGNVDIMKSIKPQDFIDLSKSDKFTSNFKAYTPLELSYAYLGVNMTSPKLTDVKTRQGLAHLVDVQRIIKDAYYGYAQQVAGAISPMDSMNYDNTIKPYTYNIDTAKILFAEAGWKDTDGDGILDKVIDGKKTDFTIDFLINAGNDTRKKVALIFQEAARKVGITVNVVQQDWNVYLDNVKKHVFDIYYGAWVFQPGPQDFKQVFYTSSSLNGGSNWVSFGNAKSDALIDSIRTELNDVKRAGMQKRLQQIMHEQCGYIFLYAPEALIAINKRFSNAYPSCNNPFYWEAGFKASEVK
ncbi:MAG TPA: ABC transporter substrate-binding protein [Bacteroidia bacterium]|jgi:peptide/nickel transport system substrate-binding protein|nr:ABC transporter substrate-binding protein [Bacteroidia bacterium]